MDPLADLLGQSSGIVAVREKIQRLLPRHAVGRRLPPVLLQGETGTGKGLLARILHRASPRAAGPFVDVNCAAIPETLLEAELFGFERGAFTDARHAKPGLFQTASGGTLFLDEVGLLPEALQAKLLKVIEDRTVRRLGSTQSQPVDVWILAASNEDLAAAARERRFREDLYHRLAVLTLTLPPLRERGEDVLLLADHHLARVCADYGLSRKAFSADARAALLAYDWPGNVRELANAIERAALLRGEAAHVTAEMLALPGGRAAARGPRPPPEGPLTLSEAVGAVEREHLVEALRHTDWNISRAAARLGVTRNTLRYRMEKYALHPDAVREPRRRVAARPTGAPSSPPPEATVPAVRWEERHLTLLRVALGSGPGEISAFESTRQLEVVVDKVRSFGGRVEELGPTGVVATFGVEPVEDAPRRAGGAGDRPRARPGPSRGSAAAGRDPRRAVRGRARRRHARG